MRKTQILVLMCVILLTLGGIISLSAAAAREATELEKVVFRLDWLPSAYHAPVFVSLEKGFWEEQGLDVEVQFGRGSTDTATMVSVGQADFGWANTVVTTDAIEKGLPLRTIYGTYQRNALGIMVLEESGITSVKDLEGRSITMTGAGEEAVLFPLWLRMNDVDYDKVERVIIDSRETRRAMLLEGRVDAFWETLFSNIPVVQTMTDKKIKGIMISEGENPLNLLLQGLITNNRKIENNPDQISRFVRGFRDGFAWSIDNPEEAMRILMNRVPEVENYEVSLGILINSFDLLQTDTSEGLPLGMYAEKDWDITLEIMVEMGNLSTIRPHSTYYTNEFVPVD